MSLEANILDASNMGFQESSIDDLLSWPKDDDTAMFREQLPPSTSDESVAYGGLDNLDFSGADFAKDGIHLEAPDISSDDFLMNSIDSNSPSGEQQTGGNAARPTRLPEYTAQPFRPSVVPLSTGRPCKWQYSIGPRTCSKTWSFETSQIFKYCRLAFTTRKGPGISSKSSLIYS